MHFRRFLRLKSFFAPYSMFRLEVASQHCRDVEVAPVRDSRRPARGQTKYLVRVPRGLLNNDAPEWLEPMILNYALRVATRRNSASHNKQLSFAWEPSGQRPEVTLVSSTVDANVSANSHPRTDLETPTTTAAVSNSNEFDLAGLWLRVRRQYFPRRGDLDSYRIRWLRANQTRTLACCNTHTRTVTVAGLLNDPAYHRYLEPLIYHEMCHAVLGPPKVVRGRRVIHGKAFKELERLHPEIPILDKWIADGGWRRAVARDRSMRARVELATIAHPTVSARKMKLFEAIFVGKGRLG